MLYFLHGTDTQKSRKKMHEILGQLSVKRPNSEIFKMNSENWNAEQFFELLSSQGLFEQKYIVVLDSLLGQKDVKQTILEKLSEMQEAEHWFLVLDGRVDAPSIKKIEKHAFKSVEFEKKEVQKESPIIFSITDKLLARDKKSLWISYNSLVSQGVAPEEIHGVVFWAVKNMIIASRVDSQKDSGLSPFVYRSALTGTRHYKTEELKEMSSSLIDMVHRVRNGEGEMDIMLEKWMLGV